MIKSVSGRAASFTIVAAVYLLAAAVGVGVYFAFPFHFAVRLLLADIAATVLVFLFSLLFGNASVYDPYWSVQPPVILTAFAIAHGVNSLGVMLLIAVWFWAIRLTANWAYTFRGLSHQDWRYTMLKEKTGRFYPIINFIGIHMVPTLVVYGCILPAVYALVYRWEANAFCLFFALFSLLAATLQLISDMEMHAFRRKKAGGFIRFGLWKHCRHPNYLGEISMWWGIALSVFASSVSPLLLLGALANTLLFLSVSIPMADGRQSRKEGWQSYKAETRMLFPIPKKHL